MEFYVWYDGSRRFVDLFVSKIGEDYENRIE